MALILGIETSCDETAAAVVAQGRVVCSNVVASQSDLHAHYGGVFPEIASRQHVRDILPVVRRALDEANVGWDDLAAIAVTYGPGLAGSLLVGVNVAKGLALSRGLPLVGVNHMDGHLYSNWLHVDGRMRTAGDGGSAMPDACEAARSDDRAFDADRATVPGSPGQARGPAPTGVGVDGKGNGPGAEADSRRDDPAGLVDPPWPDDPPFPHLLLTVSGGHTDLVHVRGHGDYRLLGSTLDDAAGEAFDKAARMLGLAYPGGPAIQRAAEEGDPAAIRFPVAETASPFDFSFSGLKSAVRRHVEGAASESDGTATSPAVVADIAAGFQAAVVRALVGRVKRALGAVPAEAVLVAGGVSANTALRAALEAQIDRPVRVPPLALCTDNAAMIAAAGWFAYRAGRRDGLGLDVAPGLRMG